MGSSEELYTQLSPLVRSCEPLGLLKHWLVYLSVEMSPLGMCKMKTGESQH